MTPDCICDPPALFDGTTWRVYSTFWGAWFGECIYTPRQHAAMAAGLASLVLYGIALLPQAWHTYCRKSASGVSYGLFGIWALGDLANTLGAWLTQQFATQRTTGLYFLATDVFLVGQLVYYARVYPKLVERRERRHPYRAVSGGERRPLLTNVDDDDTGTLSSEVPVPVVQSYNAVILTAAAAVVTAAAVASTSTPPPLTHLLLPVIAIPPLCNASPSLPPPIVATGSVLAWASGLLYFFSRVPQIREHQRSRSVAGISISMFAITITANLMYGASVLLRIDELSAAKFWASTFPYVLGSVGTLVSDFVIFGQYVMYRGNHDDEEEAVE
ncbi:hypothetical protein BC828DRAFT_383652 [Blastocladiella britannica]|nr:hypothetical protein BC828DRAFT_383652 [Blastocladiella britannica]